MAKTSTTKSKKATTEAQPLTPDEALTRLRALCFGFPAVEEKASHGSPSFFVRGKQFASFTMGYGRGPSAWVKGDLESQARLVDEEPERYFVPPYVGVKGWVGVVLGPQTDWERLGVLLEGGWDAVAPRTARDAPVLPPPKNSPRLMTTDKKLAEAVISKIEMMCREVVGGLDVLGEVEVERHNAGATMRAFGKPLCYVNDNHHNDGILSVSVRCPLEEAEALAAKEARFYVPPYIGKRGWLAIRVDQGPVDWSEVGRYLAAGVLAITPKKVVGARKKRG